MARFVVQQHATRDGTHFDLMLETGDALMTWRIPEPPDGPEHGAERIADHRKEYLTYEGPVSDDRGDVRIWDLGTLDVEEIAETHMLLTFHGATLRGRYTLLREGEAWTLTRMAT